NIVRVVFEEFLQFADEVFGFLDGEWDYPTFVENVEKLLDDLGKKLCREVLESMRQQTCPIAKLVSKVGHRRKIL
ncbi:MAG: hypothetical protein GX341_09200, partial [Firmicutes bacterium]|nr:hypothetical protein [Bacillota bacterium]